MTFDDETRVAFNADLAQRVVIRAAELPWSPGAAPGLDEKLLDRGADGCETKLLRVRRRAPLSWHADGLGVEALVIEGSFADGSGDHGAGSYVRYPAGARPAPVTAEGCIVFLKRAPSADGRLITRATAGASWETGLRTGTAVIPLYRHGAESAALMRYEAGAGFYRHRHIGGEEILVLSGSFADEHGEYPAGTWIRSPSLSAHEPSSKEGCVFYIKTGHLVPAWAEAAL